MIEEQVFRNTHVLLEEVTHELSAYWAWQYSGGIGRRTPHALGTPFSLISGIESRVQSGQRLIHGQ
jgi:hypothetical protein